MLNIKEITSAFIVLFVVIDVLGSLPIVVSIRERGGSIIAWKATVFATLILIAFMYLGQAVLGFFGVDINSFAVAGSIVMFVLSLEMLFGVKVLKQDSANSASIVPVAFPLVAGPGTFTTLLSLRTEYSGLTIILALLLNMVLVFAVLQWSEPLTHRLGKGALIVSRKFFGIILLAMAVRLFTSNIATLVEQATR